MCSVLQINGQNIENELSDYDFALNELELNYAGFPRKTSGGQFENYKFKRDSLRSEVMNGSCRGYDAVAKLFAWFEDFHLQCGGWLTEKYMQRQQKSYSDSCEYSPKSLATIVDTTTFLIRFPSCAGKEPSSEWIENSVKDFLSSGCENLILDVRGNGGGGDMFIQEYIALLYDQPGTVPCVKIRNGESNRNYMREVSKRHYRKMKKHKDSVFVSLRPHIMPFKMKRISPLPKKAAIIIDGRVASVAEGMLMNLRSCSSRTRFYGRDNTMGCLDHCNARYLELPNSKVKFCIPMTRSYYLTDFNINIDDTGIVPDVYIKLPLPEKLTDNIDEWVLWVAKDLR